jgi:glycosyltransferase involved in cell wall biosynthesis
MQDGITGLLADERDTDTLAENLLRFLTDDGFWSNARQEGMRWVRDRFLVEKQTAQLEGLYDRAREQFRSDRFEQDAVIDG